MAKRYPLSRASKEYDRLTGFYPQLPKLVTPYPQMNSGDRNCLEMALDMLDACSAKTGMPIDLTDTASTVDGRWVMSDDLPWIARWHACRQVYKIDRTVSDTLVEQELDGDLPVELLHRMPYPIIYVDAHVPVSCQTTKRWADGFFAYLDRDLMGELDMTFVYLMDDGTRSRMSLVIEDGATLETCLAHIADVDDVLDELTGGAMANNKITDPEELACLRYCATASLNLLLFVLSAENGAEIVYTPPKTPRGAESWQAHEHRDRPYARSQDWQRHRRGTPSQIRSASGDRRAHRGASRSPSPLAELLDRKAQGPRGRQVR